MLQARQASLKRCDTGRPVILTYFRKDEEGFYIHQRGKSTQDLKQLVAQFINENFFDQDSGTNIRAYHSFDLPSTFAGRLRVHLQNTLDEHLKDSRLPAQGWDISEKGAPYRGLKVFDVDHEDIFFGREQEIADIQVALDQQARTGHTFVLIVGTSGSGKSSLPWQGPLSSLR